MSDRRIPTLVAAAALAACGGAPALQYVLPPMPSATYDYEDETVVNISAMGQSMQLTQEGTAQYGIVFASTPSAVAVTLTILDLDATLSAPIGGTVTVDEGDVEGPLEFSLDRLGNATITARPTVRAEASQMVSGLSLAHTFFPGLPGRSVGAGDSWVDTVSYEGDDGPGSASETSIIEYRVIGDTVVAGRSLLTIEFDGTSESTAQMEMGGMAVSQASELALEGHVLWDHQAGMMFEMVRTGSGSGTVSVPIVPTPLPIQIQTTRRARLQDM